MNLIRIRFQLLLRFLKFYLKANTIYGLHSPFVYELCQKILHDNRTFYAFPIIENLRGRLLKSNRKLDIKDFGAGSQINPNTLRTISNITKNSAISPYVGKLLFRLVNHFKPKNILELGTSMGISTLYQSAAALNAKVITIEGCSTTADIAQQNFTRGGTHWINLINETFENGLPMALESFPRVDYVYIDGDHRSRATIQYFNTLLPHLHNDSILVIADIYWSSEMMESWKELCQHPKVSLSVDFYHFGILFFRKEQIQKMNYQVVPYTWKPWSILTKQ